MSCWKRSCFCWNFWRGVQSEKALNNTTMPRHILRVKGANQMAKRDAYHKMETCWVKIVMSLSSLIFLAGNPGGPPLPILCISRQEDRHLVSTWTSGSLERHTLPERASTNVCTPSKHFCAADPLHISHTLPCSQPPQSLYGSQTSPPSPPSSTYSLQLVPPPHMAPNQWEPPQSSNSISCFYVFTYGMTSEIEEFPWLLLLCQTVQTHLMQRQQTTQLLVSLSTLMCGTEKPLLWTIISFFHN